MKTISQTNIITDAALNVSTPRRETQPASGDKKIYLAEMKSYPYQPNIQVEILQLQAEADALLLQLKAMGWD